MVVISCFVSFRLGSGLVYDFTEILWEARKGKKDGSFTLSAPEGFSCKEMDRFITESIDFTDSRFNDGHGISHGISLHELTVFIAHNACQIEKLDDQLDFVLDAARHMNDHQEDGPTEDNGHHDYNKNVFLMYHRSVQRSHACVYSVIKNRYVLLISSRATSIDSECHKDLFFLLTKIVCFSLLQESETNLSRLSRLRGHSIFPHQRRLDFQPSISCATPPYLGTHQG